MARGRPVNRSLLNPWGHAVQDFIEARQDMNQTRLAEMVGEHLGLKWPKNALGNAMRHAKYISPLLHYWVAESLQLDSEERAKFDASFYEAGRLAAIGEEPDDAPEDGSDGNSRED